MEITSIDFTVYHYKTNQAAFRLDLCSNDQITDQKFRPYRYTEESGCFKYSREKKTIDFFFADSSCGTIYKNLLCVLLHSFFLLWQKARVGICCRSAVLEHTFRGFFHLSSITVSFLLQHFVICWKMRSEMDANLTK